MLGKWWWQMAHTSTQQQLLSWLVSAFSALLWPIRGGRKANIPQLLSCKSHMCYVFFSGLVTEGGSYTGPQAGERPCTTYFQLTCPGSGPPKLSAYWPRNFLSPASFTSEIKFEPSKGDGIRLMDETNPRSEAILVLGCLFNNSKIDPP